MSVIVEESASGTEKLDGLAPSPINVLGRTFDVTANYQYVKDTVARDPGGGFYMPKEGFGICNLSYNASTTVQTVRLFDFDAIDNSFSSFFVQINMSDPNASPFTGGSGYYVEIRPGQGLEVAEWNGPDRTDIKVIGGSAVAGDPSTLLPNRPFHIDEVAVGKKADGMVFAFLKSGAKEWIAQGASFNTFNHTRAGFRVSSASGGHVLIKKLVIEDTPIDDGGGGGHVAQPKPDRHISRGIARGIERGIV
jgi:hypothetical protein